MNLSTVVRKLNKIFQVCSVRIFVFFKNGFKYSESSFTIYATYSFRVIIFSNICRVVMVMYNVFIDVYGDGTTIK